MRCSVVEHYVGACMQKKNPLMVTQYTKKLTVHAQYVINPRLDFYWDTCIQTDLLKWTFSNLSSGNFKCKSENYHLRVQRILNR